MSDKKKRGVADIKDYIELKKRIESGTVLKDVVSNPNAYNLDVEMVVKDYVYSLIDLVKKDIFELIGEDELLGGIIIYNESELIKRLKKWFGESAKNE